MRLYALVTPSHEVLLNEWLVPTLQDHYDLRICRRPQIGPIEKSNYNSPGFVLTMRRKVEFIRQAIRECWGEVFVFSDVDIQFFKPTQEIFLRLIRNHDLLFQRAHPSGSVCPGLIVCRAGPKTLRIWEDILQYMQDHPECPEQPCVNHVILTRGSETLKNSLGWKLASQTVPRRSPIRSHLRTLARFMSKFRNCYQVRWNYLPREFFSGGVLTGVLWEPGMSLKVPEEIILHHANYTIGIQNKIAQLKYVRSLVENRSG